MFLRILRRPLAVLSLAVLMAQGCTAGSDEDDAQRLEAAKKLLDRGKALLGENRWGEARETFERVLIEVDGANREARFGIVLADLLSFTDTIRLVSTLSKSFSAAGNEENQFVNQLISDLIHDLRAKFQKIDNNLLLVESDPGFTFEIERLPIYLTDSTEPTTDLKGEWDRADAFLLNAGVRAIIGILNLADSIDLRVDVLRAYDYFSQSGFSSDKISHLQSLVTYVLNDPNYPNFLGVKPEGGNELVAQAGRDLGAAVKMFQTALYLASLETDDQADDMLAYVDQNKNGRYDPPLNPFADQCKRRDDLMGQKGSRDEKSFPEPFDLFGSQIANSKGLPYLIEQNACLFQKLRVNLTWDDIQDPPAGLLEIDHKQLVNYQEMYAGKGRPRVNLANDVLPLLDNLIVGLAKGGSLPINLPIQPTPGLVMSLIKSFVGDSLELDPYAFFHADASGQPGNVRGLLPAWQRKSCTTKEDCLLALNLFILELECANTADPAAYPSQVVDSFLCKKAWIEPADKSHPAWQLDTGHFAREVTALASFTPAIAPIAADGILGYLPYIAFQDASFHGVLYVNLAGLATAGETSSEAADALKRIDPDPVFSPATLLDLNAYLATISSNSLIKGFLLEP